MCVRTLFNFFVFFFHFFLNFIFFFQYKNAHAAEYGNWCNEKNNRKMLPWWSFVVIVFEHLIHCFVLKNGMDQTQLGSNFGPLWKGKILLQSTGTVQRKKKKPHHVLYWVQEFEKNIICACKKKNKPHHVLHWVQDSPYPLLRTWSESFVFFIFIFLLNFYLLCEKESKKQSIPGNCIIHARKKWPQWKKSGKLILSENWSLDSFLQKQ